jgi:hypothetical protein
MWVVAFLPLSNQDISHVCTFQLRRVIVAGSSIGTNARYVRSRRVAMAQVHSYMGGNNGTTSALTSAPHPDISHQLKHPDSAAACHAGGPGLIHGPGQTYDKCGKAVSFL